MKRYGITYGSLVLLFQDYQEKNENKLKFEWQNLQKLFNEVIDDEFAAEKLYMYLQSYVTQIYVSLRQFVHSIAKIGYSNENNSTNTIAKCQYR